MTQAIIWTGTVEASTARLTVCPSLGGSQPSWTLTWGASSDDRGVVRAVELDGDSRLGVSIGVLEQVANDPTELFGAPAHLHRRDGRRHDMRARTSSDPLDLGAHDVVEIDRSMRYPAVGIVGSREEEEVADEVLHAPVVVEQVGCRGRPVRRRRVADGDLELGPAGSDRALELV